MEPEKKSTVGRIIRVLSIIVLAFSVINWITDGDTHTTESKHSKAFLNGASEGASLAMVSYEHQGYKNVLTDENVINLALMYSYHERWKHLNYSPEQLTEFAKGFRWGYDQKKE